MGTDVLCFGAEASDQTTLHLREDGEDRMCICCLFNSGWLFSYWLLCFSCVLHNRGWRHLRGCPSLRGFSRKENWIWKGEENRSSWMKHTWMWLVFHCYGNMDPHIRSAPTDTEMVVGLAEQRTDNLKLCGGWAFFYALCLEMQNILMHTCPRF